MLAQIYCDSRTDALTRKTGAELKCADTETQKSFFARSTEDSEVNVGSFSSSLTRCRRQLRPAQVCAGHFDSPEKCAAVFAFSCPRRVSITAHGLK